MYYISQELLTAFHTGFALHQEELNDDIKFVVQ
jgi:hypothetical protein